MQSMHNYVHMDRCVLKELMFLINILLINSLV